MVKKEEVEKLVKLAFLDVDGPRLEAFAGQMGQIVDYIAQLENFSQLDQISSAKPVNVFREDKVDLFNTQEVVDTFSQEDEGYLVVPRFH